MFNDKSNCSKWARDTPFVNFTICCSLLCKYPEEQCREDYTGEKGRHLIERVKDRSGKDARSHLFKHSVETKYKMVRLDDFKIIGKGWKRSKFRCKLAELLHIKEKRPFLNTQEASVPLNLFNSKKYFNAIDSSKLDA